MASVNQPIRITGTIIFIIQLGLFTDGITLIGLNARK
jgi:hypothetical protein